MRQRIFWTIMILLLMASGGWTIFRIMQIQEMRVNICKAELQDISSAIETIGVVEPGSQYNIMTETGGLVSKIFVKEGQKVQKGQLLLQLDISLLQRQLEQAQITLALAENAMQTVQTEQALQEAETIMATAQAYGTELNRFNKSMDTYIENKGAMDCQEPSNLNVKLAKMKVQDIQKQIDSLSVRSRMKGQILTCILKEGEVAAPGISLMLIGDTQSSIIRVNINEIDINRITIGEKVMITGDALGDEEIEGKIIHIKPAVNRVQNVQGVDASGEAEILPIIKNTHLMPGITVNASITCEKKLQVCIIPFETLQEDDKGEYVFLFINGVAIKREVKTGIHNDMYVEIIKGIKPGDQLIRDISKGIISGMKVKGESNELQ